MIDCQYCLFISIFFIQGSTFQWGITVIPWPWLFYEALCLAIINCVLLESKTKCPFGGSTQGFNEAFVPHRGSPPPRGSPHRCISQWFVLIYRPIKLSFLNEVLTPSPTHDHLACIQIVTVIPQFHSRAAEEFFWSSMINLNMIWTNKKSKSRHSSGFRTTSKRNPVSSPVSGGSVR